MELTDRIAVVTGASSGIGRATATHLAAAGMQVVAVARRRERVDALAAAHPRLHAYAADVTDDHGVTELAEWVAQRFGACHVLVNCAGIGGGRFSGMADVADVRATMEVNFFGALRCMAAFRPLLAAEPPGRIVNVGSVGGKIGIGPAGYAASKFALVGFTEALRLDWRSDGITVAQVNPGFVRTEGFDQRQLMATPAARLVAEPDVVADAIAQVIVSGATERTVPRWYRSLVVLRHLAAPLFWNVAGRTPRAGGHRD
jgi:NAD(P)-dependent dehydrogenase (short-subunit alcohol dehydrogenase family)